MQTEYRNSPRDEAEEKIECYILEESLQPHDRLPSERELSRLWGLNRSTLRSAMARLIREGRLYTIVGSGTYVSEPKISRNLQDLKSFSKLVSEYNRKLETKVVSKQIVESDKFISKNLQVTLGYKILKLIRIRIVDDIPVILETSYLDHQRYSGLEKYDFGRESLYAVLEEKYQVNIAKGDERISVTYATDEDAGILNIPTGQAVFSLSGVVLDPEDIPVEYFTSLVRSEYIRFASELTRRQEK